MATNFFELATSLKNLGAKWLSEKKINFMPCQHMNSEHHTYNCIDNTYINVHCWLLFILVGIVKEKTHTRTSYTRQFSPLVGLDTWFILLTRTVWLPIIWTHTHSNVVLTQTKTQCLQVSFLIVSLILPPWNLYPEWLNLISFSSLPHYFFLDFKWRTWKFGAKSFKISL